jgi:F-type H+-transporting ATPase subunit gamma
MATAREIRSRIRSVKNIAKVTGALETVAASRVRKAQAQALATRPYAKASLKVLRDIAGHQQGVISHPYLDERLEVKAIIIILMTSDRGLAGPYNSNVIRAAIGFERKQTVPVRYVTVGRKGRDLMLRRGAEVIAEFTELPAAPSFLDAAVIARTAVDDFLGSQVDEVFVAYTRFVNMLYQEPQVERLLPLQPIGPGEPGPDIASELMQSLAVYSYEPDAEVLLNEILPRFTELQVFHALLEALASEHSARMVAMRNATENANALADDLTLRYNKARQLAITGEILDIVGGAEALIQAAGD